MQASCEPLMDTCCGIELIYQTQNTCRKVASATSVVFAENRGRVMQPSCQALMTLTCYNSICHCITIYNSNNNNNNIIDLGYMASVSDQCPFKAMYTYRAYINNSVTFILPRVAFCCLFSRLVGAARTQLSPLCSI